MSAIMKRLSFPFVILAFFATLFTAADAWRFNVGGNGGWVINPQESYNTWAERNRFQVNDTLYFKYPKGSDSVQQVMKADFDGCNIRNPLKNFDDGESVVMLNRSGPFYFISGNEDHCKKGQKLIVVVLAVRNHPSVPNSPAQPPKSSSPIAPAQPPSKSQPPKSSVSLSHPPKSSSPVSHSPSHGPAKSPTTPSPSPKSPSPVAHSPAPSHAPSQAPSASPKSPSPASSPSSTSPSPDQSPTSSPSEQTPPTSPSPSETSPSDNVTAPAPSPKNSASGVAVTSVMTTALSVVFTFLMFA